jgi:hypothetical protein
MLQLNVCVGSVFSHLWLYACAQCSVLTVRRVGLCTVGTVRPTAVTQWPWPDDVAADNSVRSLRFEMVVALSRLQQVKALQSGQLPGGGDLVHSTHSDLAKYEKQICRSARYKMRHRTTSTCCPC